MKLKDADALKDKLCEHCSAPFIHNCTVEECRDMLCSAMNAIDDVPTIDAVPVKHGYWRYSDISEIARSTWYECTCCGKSINIQYNYCPSCGAEMDEEM